MWLERMKGKCKRQEYTHIDQFIADMQLMRDNSEKYNTAASAYTLVADSLLQEAIKYCD